MGYTLTSYLPVQIKLPNAYRAFGLDDDTHDEGPELMDRENPHFVALVLSELSKRLVDEIQAEDVPEGDTLSNYRTTCAVDALADHLGITVAEEEVIDLIPFGDLEERRRLWDQVESAGLLDVLYDNARREKTLSWLVENSEIELV